MAHPQPPVANPATEVSEGLKIAYETYEPDGFLPTPGAKKGMSCPGLAHLGPLRPLRERRERGQIL